MSMRKKRRGWGIKVGKGMMWGTFVTTHVWAKRRRERGKEERVQRGYSEECDIPGKRYAQRELPIPAPDIC